MSIETPHINAPRLDGIQILRGFAALAVVITHLFMMERKYSPDQILGDWADLGALGVDLFFVISGFIMVYVTQDRSRAHSKPAGFLLGRITRIYPLYWAISAALLCVWLVRPDMVFSSAKAEPDLIKSFFLWPDIRDPLLAVAWTLIHEMYFYIVFTAVLLFARKWLAVFLIGWGLMTMAGWAMGLGAANYEARLVFNPLTLEFILGAFTAMLFIKSGGRLSGVTLLAGAALLLVSCAALMQAGAPDFDLTHIRAAYFAIPAALITYGMAGTYGMARLGTSATRLRKWGIKLGDWSYALYLSHVLSLSLIGYVWARVSKEGPLDNFIALLVMLIFALGVAALLHIAFEKPVLKLSKRALKRLGLRD